MRTLYLGGNMKFFYFFMLCLFSQMVYAASPLDKSVRVATVSLSKEEMSKWKTSYEARDPSWGIEKIPVGETPETASRILSIHYIPLTGNSHKSEGFFSKTVDQLKATAFASYPGAPVQWRLIEKNAKDCLYQWSLDQDFGGIPRREEIIRVFLVGDALQMVSFISLKQNHTAKQREECLEVLRNRITFVDQDRAEEEGFSIMPVVNSPNQRNENVVIRSSAPKEKVRLADLGKAFSSWVLSDSQEKDTGLKIESWAPTQHDRMEFLSISKFAERFDKSKLEEIVLKVGKPKVEGKRNANLVFNILEKTPDCIKYHYSYRDGILCKNGVGKVLFQGGSNYMLVYELTNASAFSKEQLQDKLADLEGIVIK